MRSCLWVCQRRAISRPALSLGAIAAVIILLGCSNFVPPVARAEPQASSASLDDLSDLETRFKSVAEKVSPAVVAISASSEADNSPAACRVCEMSSDKLQAFLSKTTRMVGTGFVIDSSGYILTNDHVIDDAEQLWITTDDRKVYPAIVVGSDPRSDLAVLKVPGKNMPTVHLGDGSVVRRGQWSIAMGNPYGLSGDGGMCLSVGVVSAVNRSLPKLSDSENRLYADLIQTTAQINPGNSGGPLFDLHGDVIGINTAVIMPQKSINGIGFAMPITAHLLDVVKQLKQGNEVVYAYLGVVVSNPSDHDRELAGLTESIGAHVDSIQADSPADGGLINPGDIITAIGSCKIVDSDTFVRTVGTVDISSPVSIQLMREGKLLKLEIALRKRQLPVAAVTRETQRLRWAGMLVVPATEEGHTAGLKIQEIDPCSPFVKRGVREGVLIRSIAGQTVTSLTDLQRIINDTPVDRCDFVTKPDPATITADIPTGR
jgi:S1-C subfamily serine protease